MDTLSLASKLSVYNPWGILKSRIPWQQEQIIKKMGCQKRFYEHSPKTLTDPLKSLWNPLTKNGNQPVK